MKNIKKLSLITLLSASAVLTVACSQGTNNTQSTETTQTSTSKLTKENAASNILEKLEAQNSLQLNTYMEEEIFISNSPYPQGSSQISNISHSIIKDGNQYKLEDKQDIKQGDRVLGKESINIHLGKDGISYFKHFARPEWMKYPKMIKPHPDMLSNIKTYLKYNKDFDFKETEDSYTLTFKPSDLKNWTEFLKQENHPNLVSVESFEATIKVDKNTLLPSQAEVTNKGKETINNISSGKPVPEEKPYSIKSNSEFKNYNSVSPIELPEEAKNAQEIPTNK